MYESTSDEKLRELVAQPAGLTDEARLALDAEVERRGLLEPDVDPPLAEGSTPCADHPTRAVVGTCRRCGRFICYRCDGEVGARLTALSPSPPQGHCGACRALAEKEQPPLAIGGWLILLAIGLVLSPITHLRYLYSSAEFIRATEFAPLAGTLVAVDIAFGLAFFAATLWTAMRFFTKRKDAPVWLSALFLAGVAQMALQFLFEKVLNGEVVWMTNASAPELVGTVLRGAVWIPYLRLSKRVKQTFVR